MTGGYDLLVERRRVKLPEGWKACMSVRDGRLSFCRPVQFGHLYADQIRDGHYRVSYEGILGTIQYGTGTLFAACRLAERKYCNCRVHDVEAH